MHLSLPRLTKLTSLSISVALAATIALSGCEDSIIDSGGESEVASLDSQEFAGKRGGKPGGSSTFPKTASISVQAIDVTEFPDSPWFDSDFMQVSSFTSSYSLTEDPTLITGYGPEDYFGCVDEDKPCYEITVTVSSAEPSDLVYINVMPMVRNLECDISDFPGETYDHLCAHDLSFEDTARRFSLADSYRGTPLIPYSAFTNRTFVFYWQGQKKDFYRDEAHGFEEPRNRWTMRVNRDPDADDVYRFEAKYVSGSTTDGTSTDEVQGCVPAETAEGLSNCLIAYTEALEANGNITVEFLNVTSQTTGKGKKKTTSVSLNFNYYVGYEGDVPTLRVHDDTGSDLWTYFRVEWFQGGSSIDKYLDGTGNRGFPIRGSGDCVSVRPLQSYIGTKKSNLDYTANFSAEGHPGWSFDVAENGFLTERVNVPLCD